MGVNRSHQSCMYMYVHIVVRHADINNMSAACIKCMQLIRLASQLPEDSYQAQDVRLWGGPA